jgi:hypothetical protein
VVGINRTFEKASTERDFLLMELRNFTILRCSGIREEDSRGLIHDKKMAAR